MKKALLWLPLALVASGLLASPAWAQTTTTASTAVELKVGDQAPDFTLPATDGKTLPSARTEGEVGRARLVPESVHRWLNGRMQLAP